MKYQVLKFCSWKSFVAEPGRVKGDVLDAADLKTDDGQPLPADVLAVMVSTKCLVPVEG